MGDLGKGMAERFGASNHRGGGQLDHRTILIGKITGPGPGTGLCPITYRGQHQRCLNRFFLSCVFIVSIRILLSLVDENNANKENQ